MLLFFSTYCSIVPLWQSKQVTECDWGRCSELSWHRGRTDQLWIVLYRQISPPVHAIHGVILCVCVSGKSGYYGSVLTRSTVTCVYCWLGHAAPPTPAAVRVTQKRIPADFLFGRTLLIETSVHMLRSNDESPRAMAASTSSPCWTLCEDCPRSRGNTLIWLVCKQALALKHWLCLICRWWFEFIVVKLLFWEWCPVCRLWCGPSGIQLLTPASPACPRPPTHLSGSLLLTHAVGWHLGLILLPIHSLMLQVNHRWTQKIISTCSNSDHHSSSFSSWSITEIIAHVCYIGTSVFLSVH